MNALLELARFGQSYWLDDLTRSMIKSGELKRRVSEERLTGVTVNPAIFRAALTQSDDYDLQINEMAGQPANSIYESLIVTDVRDACDILRPVYDRTEGRDGFVSLEVSRTSRTTHRGPSPRDAASGRGSRARICSSRYPARPKVSLRSKRCCTRASTSTSRCCSRSSVTRRSRSPMSARSSGARRTKRRSQASRPWPVFS